MTKMLAVAAIDTNSGQIPGLPANPRLIRDLSFAKLKQSIVDFPEMLKLREIVVFPHEGRYVTIAGNMRLLAVRDLRHDKVPVKVLPADFPLDKLKEFALKDNGDFGEWDWDAIANEWSDLDLDSFGIDVPDIEAFTPNLDPETSMRQITADDIAKTRAELDENFKDPEKYVEVICPHCAKEFYIKDE